MRLHQQLSAIPAFWTVANAYFSTSVGDFVDNEWEYHWTEDDRPFLANFTRETAGTYPPCGFGIYPKVEDTDNFRYHPNPHLPVFPIRGGSWISFSGHGLAEYKFTLSRGPDDPWHEFYPPIVTYGGSTSDVCFNTKNHQGLLEKIWPATEDTIEDQQGWIQIQGKMDDTYGRWRYVCIAVNFTAKTPAEEPNKCTNTSYSADSSNYFDYRESNTDLEWACTPAVYDLGDGLTAYSSCSPQALTSASSSRALTPVSLTYTNAETTGEATTSTNQVSAESITSGTAPDATSTSNSATTGAAPDATGAARRLQGEGSYGAIVTAIGAGVMMLGFGRLV